MKPPYHPPVKRSVEIAGHKTSISLEPVFWDMLKAAARAEGMPLNALVARIDAERLEAAIPPGLAGAIRVWLATRPGQVEGATGQCGERRHPDDPALQDEQRQR